jgi:hypothetical protein
VSGGVSDTLRRVLVRREDHWLSILQSVFIFLWSLLFVIPGIIAAYRYRFAMYNLCENPDLIIVESLDMSKRQTEGYKGRCSCWT